MTTEKLHLWVPTLIVSCIFLFTGAIVCMNDILLPSLKNYFSLSYLQASLVQQSFFVVYLIFPIPIAWFITKKGYKIALATALLICSAGALLFLPAYAYSSLLLSLFAVFIISVGVALINVAANPLAAMLGKPEGAHIRVNIVQLFSRIGYSATPILAAKLIYDDSGQIRFHMPYLCIGLGTLLFSWAIVRSKIPDMKPALESGFSLANILRTSKKYPNLIGGSFAMFFYMGAEAGTAGFITSYLHETIGMPAEKAADYLTYYYLAASITCVIGIFLLHRISAARLLGIFSLGMLLIYGGVIFTHTSQVLALIIGMGAFISIVFASIFSLAIVGLGDFTEKGSALLNTTIVGGAVFPPIQGWIADKYSVQSSYAIPFICFCVVLCYGWYSNRLQKRSIIPI